ncbi:hypothetical protein [Rhodocaloribacter sp.]
MKQQSMLRLFSLTLGVFLLFIAAGCDTVESTTNPEADLTLDQDVAESVGVLMAEDTGGLLEQAGDAFALATAEGITASAKNGTSVERTYDEATGTWTITVSRKAGNPMGTRTMSLSRVYEVQFLNADGEPQKFYVTEGDTAQTMTLRLVEGSGTFETPRVKAVRTDLSGELVATGIDTDEVTLNGTYHGSGEHELTTPGITRTLTYEMTLEVIDLVGPRGSRMNLSEKVGGTLIGRYIGTLTIRRGDVLEQHDIDREVRVEIVDGEMTITINGVPYDFDPASGDGRFHSPPVTG